MLPWKEINKHDSHNSVAKSEVSAICAHYHVPGQLVTPGPAELLWKWGGGGGGGGGGLTSDSKWGGGGGLKTPFSQ